MKVIKNIILVTVFMNLILSCTKDLKEDERKWNPYILNEVLIFESSEKELDTITINKINDNVISAGPKPRLYEFKSLWVYVKQWNTKYNKYWNNKIVNISASTPERQAEIDFLLRFENANFAGWGFKLDELNKYPTIKIITKAGTFDDVIKLEPVVSHPERENEVQFMYWSKKNGYIKFERADGFSWELVDKYVQ